jgi:hypothetical protein
MDRKERIDLKLQIKTAESEVGKPILTKLTL